MSQTKGEAMVTRLLTAYAAYCRDTSSAQSCVALSEIQAEIEMLIDDPVRQAAEDMHTALKAALKHFRHPTSAERETRIVIMDALEKAAKPIAGAPATSARRA